MFYPKKPPHIVTLAFAAAVGPLAMNIFLPSLPGMANYFSTSGANIQLAVSLYLAAVAVLQLIIGPLSDKFGRRPVMIAFMIISIAGTLICMSATSIEVFLVGRILQSCSAVGMVLSRAIARDLVVGDGSASMIAYITMGMAVAPMLGPAIGGYLDELYGWQAAFGLVLVFSMFALLLILIDLGETNSNIHDTFASQLRTWPELFASRRFWGYTATCTFSSGAFFAFLGGGPLVSSEVFNLSPSSYGLYFMFVAGGYILGNFISGKITISVGINKMMILGNVVALTGLSTAYMVSTYGFTHPSSFFAFVFFVGLGNGLTLPSANAGIVGVRPKIAGSASGLGGSLQIAGGAALAAFAGYWISHNTDTTTLLYVMIGSIILAIFSSLYVLRVDTLENRSS